MSAMLMTVIGSSFLASVQMHQWGMVPLYRYPLAVAFGWLVFLLLVGLWVVWQRSRHAPPESSPRTLDGKESKRSRSADGSSIDVPFELPGSGSWRGPVGGPWDGGGGQFGGAGASESFSAVSPELPSIAPPEFASSESLGVLNVKSSGGDGGVGFDLDLGDAGAYLLLVTAVILAALAVFGAVIYAVYNAPIFFAELLIDGGVGTWLYRRANVASRPDWIRTAIKRSVWPVVVLIVLFVALAWTMQHVAPGAMSLSEAFEIVAKS